MSKAELYEKVLIQLAEQGNAQAIDVLELTKELVTVDLKPIAANLTRSLELLSSALMTNADSWTKRTDEQVQQAQNCIHKALTDMIL